MDEIADPISPFPPQSKIQNRKSKMAGVVR